MAVRISRAAIIPAILLCLITACGTDAAGPTSTEPATGMTTDINDQEPEQDDVHGTIIDARTIVFDAGTNLGGPSSHTPDSSAIEAVLATIDSHEDLAWARNYTRFIYGNEDPYDTPAVRVFFACDQPPLVNAEQALDLFETASGIEGRGDFYGQAGIALDGTLIWSNTN